jgi:ArsR family transcriptional regulator, arsenate/arsenite/antimonite-responsive transcriptional repressor
MKKPIEDRDIVRALKALGDPKRFRMVQEIAAAGELSCGQVVERFKLSQPTISHHIKILTDAGLLIVRPEAKHHFISVNRDLLAALLGALPSRLAPSVKAKAKPEKKASAPAASRA